MEENSAVQVHKAALDRSPRFPFIPLARALERASQFYENEKRGTAPFAAAAQHWGYSPTSSGAMQTFAALKNYGLLAGPRSAMRLTDLALKILLDKRPDSNDRAMAMRQAALTPSIAVDVYEKWPEGLPSDATLNHFLVLDRGFNESTALKSIEIIKQNESLTMSASQYGISDAVETNEGSDMESRQEEKTAALGPTRQTPMPKNLIQQVEIQRVRAPSGETVELRFEGTPAKRVYEFLKAYAEFMAAQSPAEVVTPKGADAATT